MSNIQANRKWNQGYMMHHEPQAIAAAVHCKGCAHSIRPPNPAYKLRCGLDKAEDKFTVEAAGTCPKATPR